MSHRHCRRTSCRPGTRPPRPHRTGPAPGDARSCAALAWMKPRDTVELESPIAPGIASADGLVVAARKSRTAPASAAGRPPHDRHARPRRTATGSRSPRRSESGFFTVSSTKTKCLVARGLSAIGYPTAVHRKGHPSQPRRPSGWLGAHAWTSPSRPPIQERGPRRRPPQNLEIERANDRNTPIFIGLQLLQEPLMRVLKSTKSQNPGHPNRHALPRQTHRPRVTAVTASSDRRVLPERSARSPAPSPPVSSNS